MLYRVFTEFYLVKFSFFESYFAECRLPSFTVFQLD